MIPQLSSRRTLLVLLADALDREAPSLSELRSGGDWPAAADAWEADLAAGTPDLVAVRNESRAVCYVVAGGVVMEPEDWAETVQAAGPRSEAEAALFRALGGEAIPDPAGRRPAAPWAAPGGAGRTGSGGRTGVPKGPATTEPAPGLSLRQAPLRQCRGGR